VFGSSVFTPFLRKKGMTSRRSVKSHSSKTSSRRAQLKSHVASTRSNVLNQMRPQYGKLQAVRTDELKGVDTQNLHTQVGVWLATTSTSGSMTVLNCVVPGSGSWNRVGRRIKMKSLRFRGAIESISQNNASPLIAATYGTVGRIVIVYDRQPSGVQPTFQTIFGSTDQVGTEDSGIFSGIRYDNTERFVVLRDKIVTLNPVAIPDPAVVGAALNCVIKGYVDEYIDMKGLETLYSGQSSPCTIGDISSGAVYMFCRVDPNTAYAQMQWGTNATSRLRFYD